MESFRTEHAPSPSVAPTTEGAPQIAGLLEYRAPTDDPQVGTGGVLKAAVAICLACLSILMGAPAVWWLLWELPRRTVELHQMIAACLCVPLALFGLWAAILTTRDYLSGRNARNRREKASDGTIQPWNFLKL